MKQFWRAILPLALAAALPAHAENELQVRARDTLAIEAPDAMAAFVVDEDIAQATLDGGRLEIVGRRAGRTLVTIVGPQWVRSYSIQVAPPESSIVARNDALADSASNGLVEARYDSGSERLTGTLSMGAGDDDRSARLELQTIRDASPDAERSMAFPWASLSFSEADRSLVLLDQRIEGPSLALDGIVARGIHVRQGALEVHGGLVSRTPWEDSLWPEDAERVFAVSLRSGEPGGTRWIPSLAWMPDSHRGAAGVASLGFQNGTYDDPWRVAAELGWSGSPGGSLDADFRNDRRLVSLHGIYRPADFAAVSVAQPAGTALDGVWTERFSDRTELDAGASFTRFDLGDSQPFAGNARVALRFRASDDWTIDAGLDAGRYGEGGATTLRRNTQWLGARFDRPQFSVASVYRHQRASGALRSGNGGRLTLRANFGPWRGGGFVDVQQQAVTMDLLVPEGSDLSRAFAELGVVASTPEEALSVMRTNAAWFADQGIELGALRTSPLRVQGGFDLGWRGRDDRLRFDARFLADDSRGVDFRRKSYLASATATWRLSRTTEIGLGYTRWLTQHAAADSLRYDSFQVLLRTSLSGMRMPGSGRPVSGQVFRDEGPSADKVPLSGVEVLLDGLRRATTDDEGRFQFRSPGRGKHEVSVQLPAEPGAYFTSPSTVKVPAGSDSRFAISYQAARLSGVVLSDAGVPIPGVKVKLEGAADAVATTDSSGRYVLRSAAGRGLVTLLPESLPVGYDLAGISGEVRQLAPTAPAIADFKVRAQRSLKGSISEYRAEDPMTLSVDETGQHVPIDASGRFILRALPAGPLTLVLRGNGMEARQIIEVPAKPGAVPDVTLALPRHR